MGDQHERVSDVHDPHVAAAGRALAGRPARRYRQPVLRHAVPRETTMDGLKPGSLDGLVDIDRGIVSREIFVSEDLYRQELDRVFARVWLFLGHESQIPRPGDYFVSSMGEE